jgi:calcium/calmodulin-dependent protein kinase I
MPPKRALDAEDDGTETGLAKYEVGEILGEGAFATVRLAVRKADGAQFAIKLINKQTSPEEQVQNELDILRLLGLHRHIVSLVDSFVLPTARAFVMELADGGEVFERICEKGAYSEADAASVVRQVALALAFMHSLGVAHRDLKPENLCALPARLERRRDARA